MLKIVALLLALIPAASADALMYGISFFTDMGLKGAPIECRLANTVNRCFGISNLASHGLSSFYYSNDRDYRYDFSVTLYSGANCNGQYDRWTFQLGKYKGSYNVRSFPTLNDNVRSFKVANFLTSEVAGGNAGWNAEETIENYCAFATPK